MIGATVTATCCDGKSLSVLADLIRKRAEVLGETACDAVVATAIDVAKSIRAATRARKVGRKLKLNAENAGVRMAKRSDLVPSYRGTTKRICWRPRGGGVGHWNKNDVCRIPPGVDFKKCVIWQVTVSKDRIERWRHQAASYMLLATSDAAAKEYVQKRYSAIADRTAGAARGVWGHVMAEISTRPVADKALKAHAAKIAGGAFRVTKAGDENNFSVTLENRLQYAVDAVKGGQGGIEIAVKKAANKIAGRLNHALDRNGDLERRFETPFPEVKRRRQSK